VSDRNLNITHDLTNNLYYDYYLTPKNMQYDELVFQNAHEGFC